MSEDHREQNRRSWNEATRAHNAHKLDQTGFFKRGGSTLFEEEVELLGDLGGKRLLHLQCNSGQDTLSLARGAGEVVGVDISDEAIAFARKLSEETGIAARFDRADVFDWLPAAAGRGERFDVVFCSYGVVCWLDDLASWARGIHGVLRPGGRLVLIEFHPVAMMFETDWTHRYPYGTGGAPCRVEEGVGDYVAASGDGLAPSGVADGAGEFRNPELCVEFAWSVAQVLDAWAGAGLRIERVREYPHANGCRMWERMREVSPRRFVPPGDVPKLPMMWSAVARRED